jgi:6-phosphogluconolactonase (cycloisomerase 2 family)
LNPRNKEGKVQPNGRFATFAQNIKQMKKLLLCALALSMVACASRKTKPANDMCSYTMLIGSYTNDGGTGIYSYRFHAADGTVTELDSAAVVNPSYLTPSADGKYIYAVSETDDHTAALYALSLDSATGKMKILGKQATLGGSPCYVSTDGTVVLTANYGGGNMSLFPIEKGGLIGAVDTLFQGNTGGAFADRQATPHVHCAVFSPDHRYIFATDFSADRLMRFTIHPRSIVPHVDEPIAVEGNSGPRHLTFSPNGKFAYLIGELGGNVTVFDYADGAMKQIQTITADTLHARGSADIHISPDGKYLYASNRLQGEGLAIFSINPETGMLAKAGYRLTGRHPRNFAITPDGEWLLVACRDDDMLQLFRRDKETGMLTDTHQSIQVSKPSCIRFL